MPVPATFKELMGGRKKRKQGGAARLQRQKASYCGLVKCIDDSVGRILGALEARGILDNTIILFTTDHGEYMGEHNLMGKNQWYRTAYQVPFLIRWPARIPAGRRIEAFVTAVDVQQTILGLMGLKPCGREQGRDASPLLRGEKTDWEDVAWIHHSSLKSAGIFTPKYELVLRENGRHQLFDRTSDPEQTRNLAADPARRETFQELARRILGHNRQIKSPAVSWLERAMNGVDQGKHD
jgi:arylsulfatase A-like enzyme